MWHLDAFTIIYYWLFDAQNSSKHCSGGLKVARTHLVASWQSQCSVSRLLQWSIESQINNSHCMSSPDQEIEDRGILKKVSGTWDCVCFSLFSGLRQSLPHYFEVCEAHPHRWLHHLSCDWASKATICPTSDVGHKQKRNSSATCESKTESLEVWGQRALLVSAWHWFLCI